MFTTFIRSAFRHFIRFKTFSLINIFGFATGIACCMLIMLWVKHELQYDRFNENFDQIYRLVVNLQSSDSEVFYVRVMSSAGPALVEQIPGVQSYVRLKETYQLPFKLGDQLFYEDGVFYADNSIFDLFSFPLKSGNPQTALLKPYTMVLTEGVARKYFDEGNPIGQTISINGDDYEITGILEDVPSNSHLQFEVLLSMETLISQDPEKMQSWSNWGYLTYLKLDNKIDLKQLENKMPAFMEANEPRFRQPGRMIDLSFQPLDKIYFYSDFIADYEIRGNIKTIYIFSGIALLILLISCLNFVNLVTAGSSMRLREVAVRKVLGSSRLLIVKQFLLETIIIVFTSMILAFSFMLAGLSLLNSLTGMNFGESDIISFPIVITAILLTLTIGLIAGMYPAFLISSFKPANIIKGIGKTGKDRSFLRRVLTVVQLTVSITLVVCTIVINNQIKYLRTSDIGFDYSNILIIPDIQSPGMASADVMCQQLALIPGIRKVAASGGVPQYGGAGATSAYPAEGTAEDGKLIRHYKADDKFIDLFSMQLIEGRNFSSDPLICDDEAIINQAMVESFGWKKPIGRGIMLPTFNKETGKYEWLEKEVVGVVKDFKPDTPQGAPGLIAIMGTPSDRFNTISLKVDPDNTQETIAGIKEEWKTLAPGYPIDITFLQEHVERWLSREQVLAQITMSFSLLAIILACLGLIGMSMHLANRRTKEIGIRKVHGATKLSIINLLIKEVAGLALIGGLIASPVAYFLMQSWLTNYTDRTPVGWEIFAVTIFIAVVVATLTVSIQSYRAASANPVKTLRYE